MQGTHYVMGTATGSVWWKISLQMTYCVPMLGAAIVLLSVGVSASSAAEAPPETESLLGRPLARPELTTEFREKQEALLAEAQAAFATSPESIGAAIWVGRRTAYLGRYREAIEVYTRALADHPDSPHLLRHRGHRWITVRELDRAVADLARAAELVRDRPDEVEPDGLPNERGIPTSTLQSNIWYHLGLAHYLRGDFERALDAYRSGLEVSANPDMLVATTYWLYHTLARLGRRDEAAAALAPIQRDLEIIENHDYFRLLIGYKHHEGVHELWQEVEADPSTVRFATVAYGLGAYHLAAGRTERARAMLELAASSPSWPAFGVIAAEADLARLKTSE